jgi:peroxiredoxin
MTQNMLKALFINGLLIGNLIAFIHSLFYLFSTPNLSWLLVTIAAGAVLFTFLAYIGPGKRARTSLHLPTLLAIVSGCVILQLMAANIFSLPFIYNFFIICLGVWAYVFWYSKLDRSNTRINVGETLPSVSFYDNNNQKISSQDLHAPLLLMFYRGNWCPLCTAQVKEMADHYQELDRRGYKVLFISPQSQKETVTIAKRFNISGLFCEDRDGVVAKKLGIFHQRGLPLGMEAMGYSSDTVMPTVIITDAQHTIIWLDETDNYRVRPEPDTFLRVIDASRT